MIIATFILSIITIACWIFIVIHYVRLGSKYEELVKEYEKLYDRHELAIKQGMEYIDKCYRLTAENDKLTDQITFLKAKNHNKEK